MKELGRDMKKKSEPKIVKCNSCQLQSCCDVTDSDECICYLPVDFDVKEG